MLPNVSKEEERSRVVRSICILFPASILSILSIRNTAILGKGKRKHLVCFDCREEIRCFTAVFLPNCYEGLPLPRINKVSFGEQSLTPQQKLSVRDSRINFKARKCCNRNVKVYESHCSFRLRTIGSRGESERGSPRGKPLCLVFSPSLS